jgi:nucleoside-diphosphate-sugar epimerase
VGEVRLGDRTVPSSLSQAVTPDVDAVVDVTTPSGSAVVDAAATAALLEPLRGTRRALVYTSGVWVLGATGPEPADEETPTRPAELVRDRPSIERQVLAAAAAGVRSVVLRPGIVHGRGGGIPRLLVEQARTHGRARYLGGPVHWPMVHVDDLADVYAAALERSAAGTLLHAVAEDAVPVAELAAGAGRAAGVPGPVETWPLEEARATLGTLFADALALDQAVSGARARRQLGWQPHGPGAVEDLVRGSYPSVRAA